MTVPVGEAEAILQSLVQEEKAVSTYQAVVRIRGEGPDGRFRVTEIVAFQRPDRIRIELLGALGTTRWVVVTSADEILVYFPGSREYLRDQRVERVVEALLGFALSPGEVMAVLAGTGLPLEPHRVVSAVGERGLTRIELGHGTIEIEAGQVLSARCRGYRVTYPTPWRARGRQVPDQVEIEGGEVRASLRLEDLDVNVALHPETFIVELPENARRLELAEVGDRAVFVTTKP